MILYYGQILTRTCVHMAASCNASILSRSKLIDGRIHEARIVVLNEANLRSFFIYPLDIAAREFGVCPTALKRWSP